MRPKIHCLMTSSVCLDNFMADVLFAAACHMLKTGRGKQDFSEADFEGRLTTAFERRTLAGISGVEFFAEVESELGKGKVKFLVREADADSNLRGSWTVFSSIQELIEAIDPLPPSGHPMYN